MIVYFLDTGRNAKITKDWCRGTEHVEQNSGNRCATVQNMHSINSETSANCRGRRCSGGLVAFNTVENIEFRMESGSAPWKVNAGTQETE